eukprot:m.190902 g.190902  ORF g.190902 m.190902 type:complete len:82 (-) comp18577_c0_seq9:741-986(-)
MSGRAEGGASQPSKSGGFVAWYNDCLSAKPLLTTSISTMIIASSGDIMCQLAVEGKTLDTFQWARTRNMAYVDTDELYHVQ